MLLSATQLEAINYVLSAIGSDPVNTADETDVDIANILRLMTNVSRDIQRKGWDFNTFEYTLYPNKDNKIRWIDTILKFSSDNGNYIKRGDYLYDIDNQTYTFTSSIVLEAIVAVDFEDLPDCFKKYVMAKTAYGFAQRYFGDQTVLETLQLDEREAWADIVQYDLDMDDYNMLQLTNVAEGLERT